MTSPDKFLCSHPSPFGGGVKNLFIYLFIHFGSRSEELHLLVFSVPRTTAFHACPVRVLQEATLPPLASEVSQELGILLSDFIKSDTVELSPMSSSISDSI